MHRIDTDFATDGWQLFDRLKNCSEKQISLSAIGKNWRKWILCGRARLGATAIPSSPGRCPSAGFPNRSNMPSLREAANGRADQRHVEEMRPALPQARN